MERWPTLAWIARVEPESNVVQIWHGKRLETRSEWFCEAVWAGDFAQADFDLTERVFGSGARVRDGKIVFVSSGSTLDRLISIDTPHGTFVSNSLPCLMQRVGAGVDPTSPKYRDFFGGIIKGINDYPRELQTSAGPVRLTYFRNLAWDGANLHERDKPDTCGPFRVFEDYRAFLQETINAIAQNITSPLRQIPMRMMGTMSSGYDSAAVSAIAQQAGLREVISISHSKFGSSDSGEPVAKALGLNLTLIDRQAWEKLDYPEVPFLSSDGKGEDVYFHGAKQHLEGCALFTGFLGDLNWLTGDHGSNGRGPNLSRGDRSGLSLTEFRLWAGFINCPIPFLGAMHIDQIVPIGQSEAMKPWDFGGDYSKPVARRILEEAGVPRGAFAIEKKAASVVFHSARNMLSPSTQKDFAKWLRQHARQFWRRGEIPPDLRDATIAPIQWIARKGWSIYGRTKWLPKPLQFIRRWSRRMAEWGQKERLTRYLFPWALERAKAAYASLESDAPVERSPQASSQTLTKAQHAVGV
jgi:hypothetical protein